MKRAAGKVLGNPVIRHAILTALSDTVYLYARAFINVVTRKLEGFSEEELEPQVVIVTLED